MNKLDKKRAFTLAELLVAMFLFSFIAVLLIPNVTQNAEKSLFTTQLKKVQNDIQQAMLVMLTENQGTLQAMCSSGNASKCFRNALAKKLEYRVMYDGGEKPDNCSDSKSELMNACKQQEYYEERKPRLLDKRTPANFGVNDEKSYSAVNLKNGATVSVIFDPNCQGPDTKTASIPYNLGAAATQTNVHTAPAKLCGYMEVDINAGKEPNMVGKDIHYFWIIDKDGIVPFGEIDEYKCCNDKTIKDLTDDEKAEFAINTLGCTYRLIQDGTISYY